MSNDAPQINPGDIINWPIFKITYRTDADKIAALLPPGIEPGKEPLVHANIYCVPVPDVPEYGVMLSVDADYRGTEGIYTVGLGIDQESAILQPFDIQLVTGRHTFTFDWTGISQGLRHMPFTVGIDTRQIFGVPER